MNADVARAVIVAGVTAYLGSARLVVRVEVVPDPRVPGTYAVRSFYRAKRGAGKGYTTDFLLVAGDRYLTSDWVENELEEVEFKTWPPRARSGGAS